MFSLPRTPFAVLSAMLLGIACAISAVDDSKDSTRKISADCECGQGHNMTAANKPWNVLIQTTVKLSPHGTSGKICTGTIITSNLVITSHQCLTLENHSNKTFSIHDILVPELSEYMVSKDEIEIFEGEILEGPKFTVEEIIHSSDFELQHSLKNRYSSSDIALIRVKADFTKHPRLSPVCLPSNGEIPNVFNKKVHYYGIGLPSYPFVREIPSHVHLSTQHPFECFNDTGIENAARESILCVRFPKLTRYTYTPEKVGGPLLLYNEDVSLKTEYVVGIATKTKMEGTVKGRDYNFAYFTNLIPLVEYLEHTANQHGSTWCKTPALENKAPPGDFIWDVEGPFIVRDTSLNCGCGINNQVLARVSGGEDALEYEFGWMALLKINISGTDFTCGGSIINDRMILTAAHCVVIPPNNVEDLYQTISLEDVTVYVNVHKSLTSMDQNAKELKARTFLYHPEFFAKTYEYDVALIVLEDPIQFPEHGRGLRPVCLQQQKEHMVIAGKTGIVSGWGVTSLWDPNSRAINLQKLEVPIKDLKECQDLLGSNVTRRVCAGTHDEKKSALGGDSGGPLIVQHSNRRWYQVGIVSTGHFRPDTNQWITLYTSVKDMVSYIDYYAHQYGAKWCRK